MNARHAISPSNPRRRFAPAVALVLASLAGPVAAESPSAELKKLTGARTKVVWVQDQSKRGRDVFAKGKDLLLMGFDTAGDGEPAPLLKKRGNYYKPLITPDGERVIFSDRRARLVYVVDFDGGDLRKLCSGAAADVWEDPDTGHTWVYVQGRNGKLFTRAGDGDDQPIFRRRLDKPEISELVWKRTRVDIDNFQLSRDGTRAGGLFPWRHGGVATLPNESWKKLGAGCWTSLAPDNSYLFWIFDGPHRTVYVSEADGSSRWKVNINNAPGIDGYEVYHPRWSNHVRFIAMTGPYKAKKGGNKIRGGGPAVEVYVGRFRGDFSGIEAWARVTDNSKGDFYPDAWIAGGPDSTVAATRRRTLKAEQERPLTPQKHWPGDREGLAYVWENVDAQNEVIRDGKQIPCEAKLRGRAVYGPHFEARLGGGAMTASEADAKRLLTECRASERITVEALIEAENLEQDGPARIVSFSKDARNRNFTLGQSKNRLVFRLRTPRTGANGTKPQVTLSALDTRPHHVLVTYRPGRLAAYLDGKLVKTSAEVNGDLSNWKPMSLLCGNELDGDRDWAGWIECVGLYARYVGPREAAQKAKLALARLRDREDPPEAEVTLKLLKATPTPSVKSLEQYNRALVVHTWEVVKVHDGKLKGNPKKVNVAHWAILDRRPLDRAWKPGRTERLTVEPKARHPQLDAERTFDDTGAFDLPVYYDPSR